jgi:transposase
MGHPFIDPELLIRMFLVGYCMGIGSERRLCKKACGLIGNKNKRVFNSNRNQPR